MEIQLERSPGQEVWFMQNNKIKCSTVKRVVIFVSIDSIKQEIFTENGVVYSHSPDNLFTTKETLLESLRQS